MPDLIKRPKEVTPRMWSNFLSFFQDGCRFWTSEDGDAGDIVIVRRNDHEKILRNKYDHHNIEWDLTVRTKIEQYVEREWAGQDFFDGGSGRTKGKVWRLTKDVTPFPVFSFDPIHFDIMRKPR